MYKMLRFLLSTFPNETNHGWYVTTRGVFPNVLFRDLLLDTSEKLTFFISDQPLLGQPLLTNHVFISEICLQKSHSLEQILLTLSARLHAMKCLVCFGWDEVKCKYWCLSVGLICKFVVRSPPDNWSSKSRKGTQFLLRVYINFMLGW